MQVNLSTIIGQWRPMAVRSTDWNRAVRGFEHLQTVHYPQRGEDAYPHGHVLWGAIGGSGSMAVCWEWAELRRGVVALCNPMNVLSNVRLKTDDGQPFTFGQTLLALNALVHGRDWQSKVCDELRLRRAKSVIPMAPRVRRPSVSHRHAQPMMAAQALAA
jgi:hypothetical protein